MSKRHDAPNAHGASNPEFQTKSPHRLLTIIDVLTADIDLGAGEREGAQPLALNPLINVAHSRRDAVPVLELDLALLV